LQRTGWDHGRGATLALRARVVTIALLTLSILFQSSAAASGFAGIAAASCQPAAVPPGPAGLRVFLDCAGCDLDYVRREITYVDYVRDSRDAQVHVLVTTEPAGGGGLQYTLAFIGRHEFAGVDDRLQYTSASTDTSDEIRRELTRRLQLGLMRYIARTPLAGDISIGHDPAARYQTRPADDPWKAWVFRSRVSASGHDEQSLSSWNTFASFSANRTTEDWKIQLGINGSFSESLYVLSETSEFTNVTRNLDASGLLIGSVGTHWGWGVGGSVTASTYVNQDLTIRVAPALQYNVFPYAESTRRQLTFSYAVGTTAFDYEEVTLFDKTREVLTDETLTVELALKQPWGQSGLALQASHFFEDPAKYRVVVLGNTDVRIYRGLSLSISASASRIRDQVYLPAAGLTPEEILVQRRQLATDHQYTISFGVAFTFGSAYNNVVNSRFGGSSGGILRTF
jgi:hypothetical protein